MKSDRFFIVALILLLGTAYLLTLLPGVGGFGDTAKFQFVGFVLGTPHATGFPGYIFLNYFFTTLFPFGTLAYKANLLSALFSVLSAIVLFRTLRLLDISRWITWISTLTFGLSFTFWSQSLMANVYTLHTLLTITTIFFFLHWQRNGKELSFYCGVLFYALSFGNHLMSITLLPAIVYLVWITDRRAYWNAKKIAFILTLVLLSA
ncbi:MAG: DUF2723 domain-containing protein, partial [bacterium]|nr:DUF2723 domain-containing protein [bacterium]